MAILQDPIMGKISGRVGNLVFRRRGDKVIISSRPKKSGNPATADAKRIRSNFRIGSKFSSFILSFIPDLKKVWTPPSNKKMHSPYNWASHHNIPLAEGGKLSLKNVITPDGNILILKSALIEKDILKLSLTFFDEFIFPVRIYGIMAFDNAEKPFCVLSREIKELSADNNYSIDIKLDLLAIDALKNDVHPILYVAAVGVGSKSNLDYWSRTEAVKL